VKCEDFVDENEPQGCEFCKNIPTGLPNIETELYVGLRKIVTKNALVYSNCGNELGVGAFDIYFCPICGRKLEE
jgi:hypothetical protein